MRNALAAALLTIMLPAAAFAYPGEQWRNRDASQILLKHNAYSDGLRWSTDASGDQYCYPILQRKQGRATNKLRPGWWYTDFISDGQVVDWIRRRRGDPPSGENPCLRAGVVVGKQPRAIISTTRFLLPDALPGEDLPEPGECRSCYSSRGIICYLVRKAETDILIWREDDPSHGDHHITEAAQACREGGSR